MSDLLFYNILPEGYSLMTNLWEIFKLKDPDKGKILENIEIREGLEHLLYNPQTGVFYPRVLSRKPDRSVIKKYFDDKNLYIKDSDLIWKK